MGEASAGRIGERLLPWPNRIRDGRYDFAGSSQQLPLTEPERRNAIHGLTRWASWTVAEHDSDRVLMEHLLHPQPGYPHALRLTVDYRLDADGLAVTTTARNVGPGECPYGAGAHPYITVGTPTVDELKLDTAFTDLERGDPLPEVDRRSLGVEPMTCAPNAFASGEGLVVLGPGKTFTSSWGIEAGP